jgi:hypothetical protein
MRRRVQYRWGSIIDDASMICFSRSIADFVIAIVLHFMHISLLYSLYSFEYMWMSKGYELSKRIRRIETYWPYYLGYGASLTLLTSISANFIVNGCIFGMVFPFFIISSFQVNKLAISWSYQLFEYIN